MRESIDLKTLQRELQQALDLINDHSEIHNNTSKAELDVGGLNNTQSLLERCATVVDKDNANAKPTLRIIHHFACSGGTLISKCLAAQPNVFLLSEIHPTTRHGTNWGQATYTPRDVITQAIYSGMPKVEKLAEDIFVENIIKTEKHARDLGGYLVLRAHSHADYCVNFPIPKIDTLTRLLEPCFSIKQLVTVRNPIDSFLSLKKNGWVHFKPGTFDEYCHRLLIFLSAFEFNSIVKYEDFVSSPKSLLSICNGILDLPQSPYALDYIDLFKVSGDSGRSGVEVSLRPRRELDKPLSSEIESSNAFRELCKRFKFSSFF